MTRHFVRISLIATVAALFSSCAGYRIGPIKPEALANVQTLAIPLVKNDTLEPRVAPLVTNAIVSQMQQDGSYKLADLNTADAVLNGRIVDIERRQLRSARDNQLRSRELNLRIQFDYEIIDQASRAVLKRGTIYSDTNVFVTSNYQTAERQAIPEASRQLAIDLISQISEGYN